MMKFSIAITLIFMMSAFLPEAWGQIFQYADKNGNVVFTDNPPAGAKAKQLKRTGLPVESKRI